MKPFFLLLYATICSSNAQIATRQLTPDKPMNIALSPAVTTVLKFPSAISGAFGMGNLIKLEHPEGSNIIALQPLSDNVRVIATILFQDVLYVFDFQCSDKPDIAITLKSQDAAAPRAAVVTPEEIKAQRPKYDAEILVGLLRRARDVEILKPVAPDLYKNYNSIATDFTSNSGTYKTTVDAVHRFSDEDAVVLRGTVENETDQPMNFDGRAVTVQVNNEVHPIKILDCARPIPPHKWTPIDVVLQGDIDGGRANLSIHNEYRIMLPGDTGTIWSLKNGGSRGGQFNVPKPLKDAPVPLTQVRKEP